MDKRANHSVLTINSGSSSTKFGLFTLASEPVPLYRGAVGEAASAVTVEQILAQVDDQLEAYPLAGIGHRLVHGGPTLFAPQIVTADLLATLRALVPFAPNHLPAELELLEATARLRPDVPQLVCFDTAFHATLPTVARRLPIPQAYDAQGVRRYGFHGLSYTFLFQELRRRAGKHADGRLVFLHLGNGSSLAAVRAGRPVDTSMGFTPIGGIMMSTRSGDLDPGIVTYIARATGADADRLEHELSHESGLKGVSGGISDMRLLLARESADPACRLAVSMYCYAITKCLGAYAAALGGLDALVFSGGIGEHAPAVRARICSALEFLGVALDDHANGENAAVISPSSTRITTYVIPTDEEVIIAQAAGQLLH